MEILQRRKFCREFLNGYNERLHPQIISKIFEIGLLFLKKSFNNKLLFSKEELDEIIKSLKNEDYVEILPLPPLKKLEKSLVTSQKTPNQKKGKCYFNIEKKNTDNLKAELYKKKMYYNSLQNPKFTTLNSDIYPYWWWNNKEEKELGKPNTINTNKGSYNININDNNEDEDSYNNNYENYEENDNDNDDYINENLRNENEGYFPNLKQQFENNEIKNKNYTIKKLTMNSHKSKTNSNNEKPDEDILYKKINNIPFKINNQIHQKYKSPSNYNNNINFNKTEVSKNKIFPKLENINQEKMNLNYTTIQRNKYYFDNGRILRIPEVDDNNINLTMIEPNIY